MTYAARLAFRSLFYRKKQYLSLFFVCLVGVGVSLSCMFLMNGMMRALNNKAKLYYGGDLQFMGGTHVLEFEHIEHTLEELVPVFPATTVISARFEIDAKQAALYFEGASARLRVIKGINFEREQDMFRTVNYVSGDAQTMAGTEGILLSKAIADMLMLDAGDTVTLMLRTVQGYINTLDMEVKGVFQDSSLFGMYTAYVDIDCLRRAVGVAEDAANRIGINFLQAEPTAAHIRQYHAMLSERFTMFPLVADKQQFYDALFSETIQEPTYALVPLAANYQDVQILIRAMRWITSFVIGMLVIIIVAGIGSTYRVLVMKRITEIGMYMALGMKKKTIVLVLVLEALLLVVCGCAGGVLCSLALCKGFSVIRLAFIPAFDIFLTNGYLVPVASVLTACNLLGVVIFSTMIAVLYSVAKPIRIMPVQALAVTE